MTTLKNNVGNRWQPVALIVEEGMAPIAQQMANIGRPVLPEKAEAFDACAHAILKLEQEEIIDRQQFIKLRSTLQSRVEMHSTGLSMKRTKR
jgi:hypothetical protein